MHLHHAISRKSSFTSPPPSHNAVFSTPNVLNKPSRPLLPPAWKAFGSFSYSSYYKGRGTEIFLPKQPLNSLSFCNCSVDEDERLRRNGHLVKKIDVATLGNLCVNIVLNVPKLPPNLFPTIKLTWMRYSSPLLIR